MGKGEKAWSHPKFNDKNAMLDFKKKKSFHLFIRNKLLQQKMHLI